MKLALAGGGTGGHVYPGIALMEKLIEEESNSGVLFLTSTRSGFSWEDKVPRCSWVQISASPRPERWRRWPQMVRENMVGYRRSYLVMKKFKPEVLLGLGGYASVPPLVSALRLGIPFLLHEQNTVPGRANLFFSRWAKRVALGFPPARDVFPPGRAVLTGNPITGKAQKRGATGAPGEEDRDRRNGRFTLLVMGGSRGASYINRLFRNGLKYLEKVKKQIRIIHLTGKEDETGMRKAYRESGIEARVFSFLDEMGWAYSHADLVVARGGAVTLTELAYWKLPSLIIPYPTATGRHQLLNARYFEKNGAALVFEQNHFSASELMETILNLKNNGMTLKKMSEKSRGLFIPEAGESILRLLRGAIEEKRDKDVHVE